MSTQLLTAPAGYPLHLDAIRPYLHVDTREDDGILEMLMGEAVETVYARTQRQLVVARFQAVFDAIACELHLDVAPLVQVVGVQYLDDNNLYQTVPATDYVVEAAFTPRITHKLGLAWPRPQNQIGSVRVTFDAGYVALMTADATSNAVTLKGWKALAVGDVVRFSNSGGALPAPLEKQTDYFVQAVLSPGRYRLALTAAGAAINLLDAGTGYQYAGQVGLNDSEGKIPDGILSWVLRYIETNHAYRGGLINTPGSVINKNPFIDYMLDAYRMGYM